MLPLPSSTILTSYNVEAQKNIIQELTYLYPHYLFALATSTNAIGTEDSSYSTLSLYPIINY